MTDAEPLDCDEFVELVTAYLEDALDPADRQRVLDHLDLCDGCSTYLEQIRATVRAVNADTFRVNVVTGPDVTAGRNAQTFYETADGDGNLLDARRVRRYPRNQYDAAQQGEDA